MIEQWFVGDVGEFEVRIWSDGRPQLWVQHGRGKDAKKGRHAAHGRVKERRAPQHVLALIEERTGISVAQLLDWIPEAVIGRLSASSDSQASASAQNEAGSSVQPGLFNDPSTLTAEIEAAAGVDLDAPVRTRSAENRASVDRFDASSSLTQGEAERMQGGRASGQRYVSQGGTLVETRRELADAQRELDALKSKYVTETRRLDFEAQFLFTCNVGAL